MRRCRPALTASLIAAAIAAAAPALAAEPAAKPPEAAAAKAGKEAVPKEKLVCRNEEIAGSLIPKRVCLTQKQIDAQREATQDLNRERREMGGTKTELLGMTPSGTLH